MYAELKQKVCKQCKIEKFITLFRYRKIKNTFESYCKKCEKSNSKKWTANNKERRRFIDFRKNLRSKFGLTIDQYNTILSSQNGGCAICSTPRSKSGKLLAVDHCHSTLKNRGLLCNECNTAIGLLKEDIIRIQNAIVYINKFKKIG